MSNKTPVIVGGKLIGWDIRTDEQWETKPIVGGGEVRIKVRDASNVFLPTKPDQRPEEQ